MEDYPGNLLELEQRFSTEADCREYLAQLRWPEGFRCPRCDGRKAWLTKRHLYHCTHCGQQTSVLAGTVFQDISCWVRPVAMGVMVQASDVRTTIVI